MTSNSYRTPADPLPRIEQQTGAGGWWRHTISIHHGSRCCEPHTDDTDDDADTDTDTDTDTEIQMWM